MKNVSLSWERLEAKPQAALTNMAVIKITWKLMGYLYIISWHLVLLLHILRMKHYLELCNICTI